jgi:hypothetical protein
MLKAYSSINMLFSCHLEHNDRWKLMAVFGTDVCGARFEGLRIWRLSL